MRFLRVWCQRSILPWVCGWNGAPVACIGARAERTGMSAPAPVWFGSPQVSPLHGSQQMEFGLVSVGDIFPHPLTQELRSENDRIRGLVELAVHAEEVGLDVFAIGEHHNPPFICSADAALLAWIGASTKKLILSTATTLITTTDPVRIAEEFATLQHLAGPRVDIMLGRGNTAEVYGWFGQDPGLGLE